MGLVFEWRNRAKQCNGGELTRLTKSLAITCSFALVPDVSGSSLLIPDGSDELEAVESAEERRKMFFRIAILDFLNRRCV